MKKLIALVAATTTIGMASAASAVSITPNGPSQADGTVTLTKSNLPNPISCDKTHLAGTVSNGVASITSATFASSNSTQNSFCKSVVATNLPWTVTALTTTTGKATNVAANTPAGACGPGTLNGTYNNSTHVLSFSNQTLAGGCTITGSLTTHNNALTIQ